MPENVIHMDDEAISQLSDFTAVSATAAEHLELARLNRLLFAVEADKAETVRAFGDKIKGIKTKIKFLLDDIDDANANRRLPFGGEADGS